MADRKSSLPSYLVNRDGEAVSVSEADLRWRRASHAVISSMLPSHGARHSDAGLTVSRSLADPRRSSLFRRRALSTIAAIRMRGALDAPRQASARDMRRRMSTADQLKATEEDQYQTVQTIKSMTATIAVKRKYRDQVRMEPQETLKGLALWKYQVAMSWQRFRVGAKNMMYELELWSGAFKVIEGQFGTATMLYFRFLRWLMFLNLYMTLIMLGLTLVPYLILKSGHDDAGFQASVNGCDSHYHFEALYYSNNYSTFVQNNVDQESQFQSVLDVLQGTGWLEHTELFYGAYYNQTDWTLGGGVRYNMSLAYLMAVGVCFLLCFLLLVKNSAKGMKEGVLNYSGGGMSHYCNIVFGAWDFCISKEKTAKLKHNSIEQGCKLDLEYQRLEWKKASRTAKERLKLYTIRILVNILVLIILGGSLYLIYYTNELLIKFQDSSQDDFVRLILQYLPSLTITFLNVIVPIIFDKVIIAEDYMPAFRMKMTLTRTVLLRLASLGVLMISLYNTLEKERPTADLDFPDCDNYHPQTNHSAINNVTASAGAALDKESKSAVMCWETYVGQQIYKLVVLNFIIVIAVTFVWEFPRRLIYDRFDHYRLVFLMGLQEFNLSKSILDLIYLQTLCWLGVFFSPFTPALSCIMLFIFFYVKKATVLRNCLPQEQSRMSKSNSLFMMVLLLSFSLAAIPIAFMIGSIQPSKGCGPFRVYSSDGFVMFDVVSNTIDGWPKAAKQVFDFLGTPGFMACALLLFSMLMYYYWAVGQGHRKMTKLLREQLKVEGQDKQFLLARVNEAMNFAE